jgi:hypothetical protein
VVQVGVPVENDPIFRPLSGGGGGDPARVRLRGWYVRR